MRRIEFTAFFLLLPLVIAVFLPPSWMFPALFVSTFLGLILLAMTPGFAWRSLFEGFGRISWGLIALVALGTFLASYAILWFWTPERLYILAEITQRVNHGGIVDDARHVHESWSITIPNIS